MIQMHMSRMRMAVIVGAVAIGTLLVCYAFFYRDTANMLNGDAVRWDALARSVAAGTGLRPPELTRVMDREPFFAVFAGAVYRLSGARPTHVLFAQSALLVAALGWFVYAFAPLTGVGLAAAAALATVLAPGVAALTAGSLLAESLALILVVVAGVIFATHLAKPKNAVPMFLGGTVLGLLALTRYLFYPLALICAAGIIVLKGRLGIARPWRTALCILGGFAIPALMWSAYVFAVWGKPIPIGTKGGAEILLQVNRARLEKRYLAMYAFGSIFGDAAGRALFSQYAEKVEPFFAGANVLGPYNQRLSREGQAEEVNAAAFREGVLFLLAHPIRYGVIGVSQFFIKNTPMLWHNGADMRHLFAETYLWLPQWFRIASVALYRLAFIILAIFVLYISVKVLLQRRVPAYLFLPAITVLSLSALHLFFDSVPRHAAPLYPFYFLLFILGVQSFWRRRNQKIA